MLCSELAAGSPGGALLPGSSPAGADMLLLDRPDGRAGCQQAERKKKGKEVQAVESSDGNRETGRASSLPWRAGSSTAPAEASPFYCRRGPAGEGVIPLPFETAVSFTPNRKRFSISRERRDRQQQQLYGFI